jgi:DME family drug/metabolite transporter
VLSPYYQASTKGYYVEHPEIVPSARRWSFPYKYRLRPPQTGELLDVSRDRLLGAFAVVAAASIWGTLGLFAKILYAQGVSFESLVAVRASIGWAAVLLFVLATRGARSLRVSRRDLVFLVPLGLVGIGFFYLLYFYTVRESTVGTAAILLYSSPAFVVVLARLFLKEALNAAKVIALFLTIGGIFLVAGAYDPANLEVSPKVLLAGLLSGVTYGLYSIFGRPVAGRLDPSIILSYALFFGASLLVVTALPTLGTLAGLSVGSYVLLLMLAVVHTTLGFALYTFGLGRLGAGRAAIVATVEPVVAGALGVVLLAEDLTLPKVVGAALVISGAVLAQVRVCKHFSKSSEASPRAQNATASGSGPSCAAKRGRNGRS